MVCFFRQIQYFEIKGVNQASLCNTLQSYTLVINLRSLEVFKILIKYTRLNIIVKLLKFGIIFNTRTTADQQVLVQTFQVSFA